MADAEACAAIVIQILSLIMFLTKEDFELLKKYGGKSASEYPEAHALLRRVYDKLGEIADGMRQYGFESSIRRNPQNQGQRFETYHWAQLCPSYSKDSVGKIFFVIHFTQDGFGIHIDCNQRNGLYINEDTEDLQSKYDVYVDEICKLEKQEIIHKVVDYCNSHKKEYLQFGKYYNIKSCIKLLDMEQYQQLLINNKNLILTGAPGTGKTYLAKEIAESFGAIGERYGFVQFHPSFDYSDFIEGLRPIKSANSCEIGFERKDGIFMAFCRKALKAYQNSENKADAPKYVFVIDEINRGEMSKIFGELFFSVDPGYRGAEGRISTQYSNLWTEEDIYDDTLEGDDKYKFYIPENVYIIGTMNDIDRSVESMDFAMRRRFAFKEVKADSRVEMIYESNVLKSYYEDIRSRMNNLNLCILTVQGLSSAYQIGASYYLKLKNYLEDEKLTDSSWENLWENHIYGLLFEYLRGVPDLDKQLRTLQKAYNLVEKYEEKDGVVKKVITEAND